MNNSLKMELERYISELDSTVNKMKNSDFPFADMMLIYEEVSSQLKNIVNAQ